MSELQDNHPIIVGVGQHTVRGEPSEGPMEPLDMMALVARKAEDDAEAKGLLARVDSVRVVNIFAWRYSDAAGLLAERVGATPKEKIYTTLGGNTPQWQVNEAAEQIANGACKVALLAGAEAVNTVRRARQRGLELPWTPPGSRAVMVGDNRPGSTDLEMKYGASAPIQVYPIFENALRAHHGWSLDEHRRRLGELCASLSRVAAENEYAWFREAKSADQIATPTEENRYVGFPYTKYMNAIMDVDQAAAVIMTSAGEARRLGIPQSRWVYLLGCGDGSDVWFWSQRPHLYDSPAIERIGRRALEAAGLAIDQIDFFDLYSCFPIAVQVARAMLHIPDGYDKPLTVTGGLPYFGGPGSNYTMHGIASMADKLRAQPGASGLVTAVGWYLSKHATGVYGTAPKDGAWSRPDMSDDQREIERATLPEPVDRADGAATVESYTVMHDREGNPELGIVVGRLSDGRRFLANAPQDRSLLESMTKREIVGMAGRARHDEAAGKNVFEL